MATALGAKGIGLLLQMAALPYAIRVLGAETFGAYATAVALVAWVPVLETGFGANSVREMITAIARNDTARISCLFATGLCITSAIAFTFIAVVFSVTWALGQEWTTLGSRGSSYLFPLAALVGGMQMVAGTSARVRAAYQEMHVTNLFGAAGNLVSVVGLFWVLRSGSSSSALLLLLGGPIVLAQCANGVLLILQKPALCVALRFDWMVAKEMLSGGAWLGVAQVGVYLEREAPKLIIAAVATAAFVGKYACAMQILVMSAGIVIMVTGPLFPAMADAINTGQAHWWRRRVGAILAAVILLTGLSLIVAAWRGQALIASLFGPQMNFERYEIMGLTTWVSTVLVGHVLYLVLVAAGHVKYVAVWQLIQGILVALIYYVFYPAAGIGTMFWTAAICSSLTTTIPWGVRVFQVAYRSSPALIPISEIKK